MKDNIRPLGEIIQDLEDLTEEMVMDHDMQLGDILALVNNYVTVHYPGAIEEYEDGSHPIYFYGCKELLENLYLKPKKIMIEDGCKVDIVNGDFIVSKGKM